MGGSRRLVVGEHASASWSALAGDMSRYGGRSVLLAATDQLCAASALLALAGVARRLVLCPPDLAAEQLQSVADASDADLVVTDQPCPAPVPLECVRLQASIFRPPARTRPLPAELPTEWVLLTSGTSGAPKLVVHTLESLAGAIGPGLHQATADQAASATTVWSTFYDIRRYGGLQIFLRAALSGASLVLSGAGETPAEFLARAAAHGVTHISGTPSHWRRVLMSTSAPRLKPAYIRLSGEIADDAVLQQLRCAYPEAQIVHAFASTEAGLVFEVADGRMGVPAGRIAPGAGRDRATGAELRIEGSTLRVRSPRTASRYLGEHAPPLRDADGWVDTGDVLELCGERYFFAGRANGTINVGGLKVHPEEVEAVLNSHPEVSMSRVRPKRSPITGALVVAEVVLRAEGSARVLERELLQFCRASLAPHKVPAAVTFVPGLEVTGAGKLVRRLA